MKCLQLLVITFISLFKSIHGLAFDASEPTPAFNAANADLINGWSPNPTTPPALPHLGLLARQEGYNTINTCGFLDQNYANSLFCSTNYGCAYWTATPVSAPQFFGCCPVTGGSTIDFSASDCNYATTCMDYTLASNPVTGDQSSIDTASYMLYCGRDAAWCAPTYLSNQGTLFTHFGCAATTSVSSTAWDYYQGAITTTSFASTPTPSTSTSASTTSTSTSPTPTPPPSSGSSNTGAIAGGVVGGVVGLAAIGGIIWYLIHRKKKERDESIPEVSQYQR